MNELKEGDNEYIANASTHEDIEEVLQRHRSEKKQLNAKITQMRHSLAKGDKKKKKEVNKEIDLLTEQLQKRHENELTMFKINQIEEVNNLADHVNGVSLAKAETQDEPEEPEPFANGIKYTETKISRAQRKREAKALKQKQIEQQIKDGMIDDSENQRLIEANKFNQILSTRGLRLCEIPSDGDCMYKAIEHQLSLNNIKTSVSELRQKTCDYMRDNKLDFLPFLTSPVTQDMMSDSEYEQYCDDIANTKSWGGQLELRAISHVFRYPIEVIQAEGSQVMIGQTEYKTVKPLILCYHRHAYSLGEHYNSVDKIV